MRKQGFSKLYARLESFRRDFLNRRTAQGDSADTPTSPLLTFVAAALFLILAILEIDLHRDELRVFGLINSQEGVDPAFMGP